MYRVLYLRIFALQTVQGTLLKIKIWDTAGDEKYKFLLPMYYKSAQVAIIVFDIDDEVCIRDVHVVMVHDHQFLCV